MRTIKKNLLQRLALQAEEAELQGMVKVASALTEQITKQPVRDNEQFYVYSSEDFIKDVESKLWDASIRAADFFDIRVDAEQTQLMVEKFAQDLIKEIAVRGGAVHGVGAHEPNVPGEKIEEVAIEVE
jgi:Ribonuclease G/E